MPGILVLLPCGVCYFMKEALCQYYCTALSHYTMHCHKHATPVLAALEDRNLRVKQNLEMLVTLTLVARS